MESILLPFTPYSAMPLVKNRNVCVKCYASLLWPSLKLFVRFSKALFTAREVRLNLFLLTTGVWVKWLPEIVFTFFHTLLLLLFPQSAFNFEFLLARTWGGCLQDNYQKKSAKVINVGKIGGTVI